MSVVDVAAEGGLDTVRIVREAGGNAIFIEADVSNATEVERLVNKAFHTYGRLDIAFNNAGIDHTGTITECTEDEWDRVMAINLKGVWLCMKFEIMHMAMHGGGSIVNMSSVAGVVGHPNAGFSVLQRGYFG